MLGGIRLIAWYVSFLNNRNSIPRRTREEKIRKRGETRVVTKIYIFIFLEGRAGAVDSVT